ncbi:MAG: cation:proton antiporter [Bacteroidaceae bacterium]|nr:cation:proton antiporter [Bacteroidaceae bacterium]
MHTLMAHLLQTSSGALISDPTWIFFLVLLIILSAPLLLRRLRIPPIIGLIVAGMLLGQYGFNVLERDSSFELFGKVGIYYIMFLAGLELNMGSVQRYGRQGLLFGLLTFGIPFGAGLLVGHAVLGYGWLSSLLLSCILASHTLVAYPIVNRYGLGRHRVAVISVVATAFAIFAALLTLTFAVSSLDPETTIYTWMFFGAKCAVYGAAVVFGFPRLGRWFLRRNNDSVLQYIFILALVFLSAALAELAGLEGLLGAFLAGLVLNRLIPHTSPLMNHIEFVGNALFIPYFLIGVGMIIDISVMRHMEDTLCMLAIVIAATASKGLAAWLMARIAQMGNGSTRLMFGLTNAHAAGALAIVMVGTSPEVNLMDSSLLNSTVMLILFSCIISSLATNKGAKQLALSDTTLEENRGSYHGKCVITYSQADDVDVMTQLAILIRNPYIADSLMGLSVSYDNEESEETHRRGKELLEQAKAIAASANVQMSTLCRMSTNISRGILHTLHEYEAGEIIMSLADRETGMLKPSLGNIINDVLNGSHREVIAIRAIVPPGTLRQVVVVVPEKAEYEVGFYKWLEHLCRIGELTDCRFEFRAHPATMWYIQGYMSQKHPRVRATYQPMPRWSDFEQLFDKMGEDKMLVVVSARPGFISYTTALDLLPQQLHQHFGNTNVMLLFPDQWGDPMDSVSVFSPNGTAVTRQSHGLFGWLRRHVFPAFAVLALLCAALPAGAQSASVLRKMSPLVRQAAMDNAARQRQTLPEDATRSARVARRSEGGSRTLCALVRTSDQDLLARHGSRILASWGDIHIADIPLEGLVSLASQPSVQRIEAGRQCSATLDTALIITGAERLHNPAADTLTAYTGRGVVMGVVDIGFDLTHPTFYSRDMSDYRIRAFWDQLDFSGDSVLYVGQEYLGREAILAKAHAADGLIQFHGTHTASTAAGSGYDSPYVGLAPEADLCLVANAVGSDMELVPEEAQYKFTSATDLLGFKYIYDYARQQGKPCVVSFSEGRYQDLYGDDQLTFEVLDSLTAGPGRILCASAGNLGRYLTYLHKPLGLAERSVLLQFEPDFAYYTLRSSDLMTVRLTFFHSPQQVLGTREVATADILACPDSLLIDTLRFESKSYQLLMASYPSCYDSSQWATELYLKSLEGEENKDYRVLLTLMGQETDVEAIASGGHFAHSTAYPDYLEGEFTHSIHSPGAASSVICVGSTAYRTGILNYRHEWQEMNAGTDGLRAATSSTGPSLMGLTKPDVMAPGMHVIAAMSSYYLEQQGEDWYTGFDVSRFPFAGRQYAWNAQSGTSMACPIVAGVIALWLQACPTLTHDQVLETIAATSRQPESGITYPNNDYGYGEINAEAGLQYVLDHFAGIENTEESSPRRIVARYDLSGRQMSLSTTQHGISIVRRADGKARKILH